MSVAEAKDWSPERDRERMYFDLTRPWFRELLVRKGAYEGQRVLPFTSKSDPIRSAREWRWAVEGMNRVNRISKWGRPIYRRILSVADLETWEG